MELLFLGLFLSVCVYMHACESIFFGNLKLGLCLTRNLFVDYEEFEARIMFDELFLGI